MKHKPSLGEAGIHGRQNAEALGCEHHPFAFEIDGIAIMVPNPLTWCNMKLIAMRDRWRKAQDPDRLEDDRTFQNGHAVKHAQDVCRAVAMATREESDSTESVADAIRETAVFANAVDTFERFFGRDEGWGIQVTRRGWRDEDLSLIRGTLARWFQ